MTRVRRGPRGQLAREPSKSYAVQGLRVQGFGYSMKRPDWIPTLLLLRSTTWRSIVLVIYLVTVVISLLFLGNCSYGAYN